MRMKQLWMPAIECGITCQYIEGRRSRCFRIDAEPVYTGIYDVTEIWRIWRACRRTFLIRGLQGADHSRNEGRALGASRGIAQLESSEGVVAKILANGPDSRRSVPAKC